GHVPFQGSHAEAVSYAIRNETPAPLRSSRPGIPEEVEQLVFRALHKEPSVRYQSGRELARALRQVRGQSLPLDLRTEPVTLSRDVAPPARTRRRRTKIAAAVAAAVVATAAGIASWRLWLVDVERIPVAIVPVVNETGFSELDPYRLTLTHVLVTELSGSPNIRVPPYGRLLQVIRRFLVSGTDVSSPGAIQALKEHVAPQFVVRPSLVQTDGGWQASAEILDASTSTSVERIQTKQMPSSILKEAAYTLTVQLAAGLEEYFKTNGPGQSYRARAAGSLRPSSIEAARFFEEGINAFEQLEYAAAAQAFAKATELDSHNSMLFASLSRVERMLRKPDQGLEAAERAAGRLSEAIPRLDTLQVNAVVAEARRDFPAAESAYRQLIDEYPDEPAWLAELGGFQDRRGQTERAIVSYQESLALDRRLAQPEVELCRLYNRSRDWANASKHAKEGLAKYEALGARHGEAQALFCLSDSLRAGTLEQRQEARRQADSALAIVKELKLFHNLARAYYYLGLSRAEEDDLSGGMAAWEEAANAARSAGDRSLEALIHMNLGVVQARLGNRRRAMDLYQQSWNTRQELGEELRASQVQVNRAQLQIDFGDKPDEAAKEVEIALKVFELHRDQDFLAFGHQTLGAYYRNLAQYETAEKELNRALAIARVGDLPEDVATLSIDLARLHFDRNDYAEALRLLGLVGDNFGPDSLHAWIRRARTHLRLGNFEAARELLVKGEADAAKRKATEYLPLLHATWGELEYESGRPNDARIHFERAAEKWVDDLPDPASVEAKAYVGLIDALRKRPAQGRAAIESSLTQAGKMRQVAIEVRCRIFLARAWLMEHKPKAALDALTGITWDGEGAVGPELLAQARYWRSQALRADGRSAEAKDEAGRGRKLLDDLIPTWPERDRQAFAGRPDIRPIRILD
ncbi:MAG TPA: protein kinase family protein, partial [Gemmatimonadales bacterium]|nr:protein kinase family protein [Gemmatimonadales bacterium]